MLHPNDELFLARLRQRELIARTRADRLRVPRPLADLGRWLPLHAVWAYLCARIFTRRPA